MSAPRKQPPMRSRALGGAFVLALAWLTANCKSDDTDARAAEDACTPGQRTTCHCDGGAPGHALCLPSEQFDTCRCEHVRALPCSAPGVGFACRCAAGGTGVEICLSDGEYTACDCAGEAATRQRDSGTADAITDEPSTAESAPVACPNGFECVEQRGHMVCAGSSGLPPFCTQQSDCAGAGLRDARCIDPGVGGVHVCALTCSP